MNIWGDGPVMYGSTKNFTHSVGLSCCFRQWRANSHCKYLHGYALQVTLDFASYTPDENGWVVDFGGLKGVKGFLEAAFDHKLVVAKSDPELETLKALEEKGIAQLTILPEVGCENFARAIMQYVDSWVAKQYGERVRLRKVTVAEHDGNTAYVERKVM